MLDSAALYGYLKIIQILVQDFQCNRAAQDNYAIRYAAEYGHLDVVKYLMEGVDEKYGIDPASENNWTIQCAASNGHLDVVKYLMHLDSKYGIDQSIGREALSIN